MDPNIQQPQRYQEWDGVVDNAGTFVDAVGYGGPTPYGGMQMHPYGGVAMPGAGNTFGPPPQFNGVPANNRTVPPQRWNMGGPGIGKFIAESGISLNTAHIQADREELLGHQEECSQIMEDCPRGQITILVFFHAFFK